jgi:hypothetical protein
MARELPVWNSTLVAGADLSAKQYYACKINSSGYAVLSGAGENSVGIIQNEPTSGQATNVAVVGESFAIYGAAVTAGANLTPDASGRLVTAGGSDCVLAVAAESGTTNEIRTVYLVTRTATGMNTKAILSIPLTLSALANGDYMTNYTPGFAGSITKISFAVTTAVTTAAKAATINMEINATNLTGGVLSLTSANCTPLGAVVDATAITAANTFTATDTISIEISGVTTFIEGAGNLLIVFG